MNILITAKNTLTFRRYCASIFPIKFQYIELMASLPANIESGLSRGAETDSGSKGEYL